MSLTNNGNTKTNNPQMKGKEEASERMLNVIEARCLFAPGGLNRRNFLKRKRENRGTQQLFREFATAAMASCGQTPSAPGL